MRARLHKIEPRAERTHLLPLACAGGSGVQLDACSCCGLNGTGPFSESLRVGTPLQPRASLPRLPPQPPCTLPLLEALLQSLDKRAPRDQTAGLHAVRVRVRVSGPGLG